MSQTVARALSIVKLIAAAPRSVNEVAAELGVHKSTALRLLQTLEHDRFARLLADGRYAVGFGVIPIANRALDQLDVRAAAHPHLRRLSQAIGHTVHLAQLIGDDVVYVDKVEGSGTVAMGSRIGLPAELHTAGVARMILAHLPEPRRSAVLERATFVRHTPQTITDRAVFERELATTRDRGWAEDGGEREDYINCVALPVRDAAGHVTLAMSVTALRAVAPLVALRAAVPQFADVAGHVSRDLGWAPEERPNGSHGTHTHHPHGTKQNEPR